MKKVILGLDLGTNSIGWALIERCFEIKEDKLIDSYEGIIIDLGSRIIPMSQAVLADFDNGVSISQTADRTRYRGARRLRERHLLRRERLHRVLNILGFLPTHFAHQIDFEKRLGQFYVGKEPKLVYDETNNFIFKDSFAEMLAEFVKQQPGLSKSEKKIPYDWTIYYLRKKALTQKIEKEELAWLLLNFNQKRGYYQLRGEEEEVNPNKLVEFHSLSVSEVTADERQKGKDETWYNIILENGWIYRRSSKQPLFEWKGKTKEFVVTTELNDDGTIKKDKEGKEKRSFRAPSENDWTLVKTKTEQTIENSDKTVGVYIYDTLLQNPTQKINGKLVRVIERKYYKEELKQILETQQKYHVELQDKKLYNSCTEELYEHNAAHKGNINKRDFIHLFLNDIIFYQRPLKSKKSLISDCKFESRSYILNGERKDKSIKCIAKSHPFFQEFRIWQWIQNLHIFDRENDDPITSQFLNSEDDYVKLFEFLNDRKEIDQKAILRYFNLKEKTHRWNFVEDKAYPCNETRSAILNKLEKCSNIPKTFLSEQKLESLWHILYSVTDKEEIKAAIENYSRKNNLGQQFTEQFSKFPPYKNEYGSYSTKAIKKLLPLMRMGKYWNEAAIHPQTKERIDKIINGEFDEKIQKRVRDKAISLKEVNHFKGLPLWLASYIIYDRHSEESNLLKWKLPADLERFLKEFKQHSLRNPIVEQVITETLRVVKDIWQHIGNGAENFFDEIHIELGREMKNDKKSREKITKQVTENENTNLRIKALLAEMINDNKVENVRPYSPSQQEILKIYEDGVLNSGIEIEDDILKISKTAQPSKNDLIRYKLWLEQKYRSPYTGEMIPLNKLFTSAYEIEHIIPQSRYFDDSFSNKVICETEINTDKGNLIGFEYISYKKGCKIELSNGKWVTLFSEEQYENFIKENFIKNQGKMKKLLMLDIPEKMIERQMNDTRYISKEVKNLLSKIVREDKNDDGVTSKNVLSTNGQITSALKNDWGLNDIWNEIITPRFERLNAMTGDEGKFGKVNENTNKFLPIVPLELQKGFSKKRIDHRHHALDALVIACATRNHINFLNNQNALEKEKSKEQKQKSREDLRYLLCDKKYNHNTEKNYKWIFKKPWKTFTHDGSEKLQKTVVSFKQNLRVINKTVNKYQHWEIKNGVLVKTTIQQKGQNWAIRKPLHIPMPYGKKVYSFDILPIAENISKRDLIINNYIKDELNEIYSIQGKKIADTKNWLKKNPIKDKDGNSILATAFEQSTGKFRKRQSIFKLSNRGQGGIKTTEEALKFIHKVADLKIQDDLCRHLAENNYDLDLAFNQDGIENFNSKRNIPVYKLPITESGEKRFQLGKNKNTRHKWMEAEKGTNLFFAIYKNIEGKRSYISIPFNEVLENQKQNASLKTKLNFVPQNKSNGDKLVFHLSPNDQVYLPTDEEIENPKLVDFVNLSIEQVKRIWVVNDFSSTIYFTPNSFSKAIAPKEIDLTIDAKTNKSKGSYDSKTASFDGIQIKEYCWKLEVDRIGKIKKVVY